MSEKSKKMIAVGLDAVFGQKASSSPVTQPNGNPDQRDTAISSSCHTDKTLTQQTGKAVKKRNGQPANEPEMIKPIKATYYIEASLIKPLKLLAVERDSDLSALVNIAIKDLLRNAGMR